MVVNSDTNLCHLAGKSMGFHRDFKVKNMDLPYFIWCLIALGLLKG